MHVQLLGIKYPCSAFDQYAGPGVTQLKRLCAKLHAHLRDIRLNLKFKAYASSAFHQLTRSCCGFPVRPAKLKMSKASCQDPPLVSYHNYAFLPVAFAAHCSPQPGLLERYKRQLTDEELLNLSPEELCKDRKSEEYFRLTTEGDCRDVVRLVDRG